MWRILLESLKKGVEKTPAGEAPPGRFRGVPVLDAARCDGAADCARACPTEAITPGPAGWTLDLAKCIACGRCQEACAQGAITLDQRYELAVKHKQDLRLGPDSPVEVLGAALETRVRRLFGRSLHLRLVDAGSCNGCEVEIGQLLTPHYDLQRFGIDVVASPRHADALLVTGPVTTALAPALRATYEAMAEPRLVIAVGACAVSGGLVGRTYGTCGGADQILPVDVYIPGCPPRPQALLHGLLLAVDKAEQRLPPQPIHSR